MNETALVERIARIEAAHEFILAELGRARIHARIAWFCLAVIVIRLCSPRRQDRIRFRATMWLDLVDIRRAAETLLSAASGLSSTAIIPRTGSSRLLLAGLNHRTIC